MTSPAPKRGRTGLRLDSFAFRLVVGAVLWAIVALLVGGIALSSAFRNSVEESFDARLTVQLESIVAASDVSADAGVTLSRTLGEVRFEEAYSGWYWQIQDDRGRLMRSRSLFDTVLALRPPPIDGTLAAQDITGPIDQALRAVTRLITLRGHQFTVSVAANRTEVEAQVDRFNGTLVWSFGVLGAGLIAAVLIQVRVGLRPFGRLRAGLAAIRRGRAERLTGRFPSEVTPLADELNAMLEQNAAVVERARTHASNLAHALKTPLAVLANEAAANEPALAQTVERQVATMRRQIDHHLVRARAAGAARVLGARTPVAQAIDDLARVLTRVHAERGLAVATDIGGDLWFRGERQDLEEMAGNLMDNACKWAKSRVRVVAAREDAHLSIAIEDDGPGLTDTEIEALSGRGVRLDESVPGSGFGLAIVRDIAGLYDGALRLERSPALGGLRTVLILPAAEA